MLALFGLRAVALPIGRARAKKQWLADLVKRLTPAVPDPERKTQSAINLALTASGLRQLGVDKARSIPSHSSSSKEWPHREPQTRQSRAERIFLETSKPARLSSGIGAAGMRKRPRRRPPAVVRGRGDTA